MSSVATPVLSPVTSARFVLLADAEPGLLPRLLAPFARRDLVPDRVASRRFGDELWVEIAVDNVPAPDAALVEGNLRQVVGVRSVSRGDAVRRAA